MRPGCAASLLVAAVCLAAGTATAAESSPSAFPRCSSHQLHIALKATDGGLSHGGMVVVFRNEARTCTLRGYPGVDGVHKDGSTSVHARRTREGYLGGSYRVKRVVLNEGEAASTIFEGINGPVKGEGRCHHYAALKITPPDAYRSVLRDTDSTLCYPEIHPVVHGSQGDGDRHG